MEKVQDIVKYINEHFNDLPSDFKIEVPPSTLPPNMDIDAQKLFKSPNFNDEMESISHDEKGKRIRLNDAQLAEISKDGTFTVPSKMYAGMDNRFRVSPLLQKGQDNIDTASHKNKVAALSNIVVDAPGTLSTNTVNVKDGLRNIWKGIAGIPVLLFGNRTMKHAHSEREIKDATDAAQEDRLVVKFVDLRTKIADIAEVYHEIGKGDHHYYSFRVTNFEKLRALDIPPVADADQLYAFLKEKLSKKDAKMFIDQLTFVASVKEKLAVRIPNITNKIGTLSAERDKSTAEHAVPLRLPFYTAFVSVVCTNCGARESKYKWHTFSIVEIHTMNAKLPAVGRYIHNIQSLQFLP